MASILRVMFASKLCHVCSKSDSRSGDKADANCLLHPSIPIRLQAHPLAQGIVCTAKRECSLHTLSLPSKDHDKRIFIQIEGTFVSDEDLFSLCEALENMCIDDSIERCCRGRHGDVSSRFPHNLTSSKCFFQPWNRIRNQWKSIRRTFSFVRQIFRDGVKLDWDPIKVKLGGKWFSIAFTSSYQQKWEAVGSATGLQSKSICLQA